MLSPGLMRGVAMRIVAAALALVSVLLAFGPSRAADARLFAEFDARLLTEGEKRLLQVGLAARGGYVGLIDGRWGPASQAAFEGYAAAAGLTAPDRKVSNLDMALLAAEADAFLADHRLAWRGGEPLGHRMLAPEGPFLPDPHAPRQLRLVADGVEIRILSSDAGLAAKLHAEADAAGPTHYRLRNEGRFVTTIHAPRGRLYLRSDWSDRAGAALTTIVAEQPWTPPGLFEVVVGSLSLAGGPETPPRDGLLLAMIAAALALGDPGSSAPNPPAPNPPAPDPAPPPALAAAPSVASGAPRGSGTAFFVNNTDLLTAAHVVEGCASVARTDGLPLDLVATHPTLDLAILTSRERSRAWIAVGDPPLLGQRVFALGYPFFGAYGTGLSMTAGNVSVLAGLADDPDALTITAPVQPGNSGGPLVARDGRLAGVVVARLDHLKVVEEMGALPENVNFAVTGAAARGFLDEQGVALPPPAMAVADVEDGLPPLLQQAVIPVLCLGP